MSAGGAAVRLRALACAAACLALVAAQYLWPVWPGFHTWQYAAVLVLAATPVARYTLAASRSAGRDGARFAVALTGALIVVMAGLAAGLLGPDTQTVARAPATVVPLPDLGAAAFFPNAGASALAHADAAIVLRRRSAPDVVVAPGDRRFLGAAVVTTDLQTAAYVAARDARGEHLTLTQPAGAAFLSPVLLFPQRVTIAGQVVPADAFAAPAAHRQIKAFYFSKAAMLKQSHGARDQEAILFAMDDDGGKGVADGIGFAASGTELKLGGLRLQPTLGRYPALVISAVPYPAAVWLGGLLFTGALASGLATSARLQTAGSSTRSRNDASVKTTSRPS